MGERAGNLGGWISARAGHAWIGVAGVAGGLFLLEAVRKDKWTRRREAQIAAPSFPAPGLACKQQHVDADVGGHRGPPFPRGSHGVGRWRSRRTVARRDDPTAFQGAVSAQLPAPSAWIWDPLPERGCSPFAWGGVGRRPTTQGERGRAREKGWIVCPSVQTRIPR